MRVWVALLGAGCAREPDGSGPVGTLVSATCALDPDNALQLACEVVTFPPGPVAIDVTDPVSGQTRVFSSAAQSDKHVLQIWGLHEDTDIAWTARGGLASISGTTTTGSVPAELGAPPEIEVSGDHRTEAVVVPRACDATAGLAMFDDEGEFLWYETLGDEVGGGGVLGFSLTNDGVIAVLGRETLAEVGFDGVIRQELHFGDDLQRFVHHDAIVSPDGYTYVLTSAADTDDEGVGYIRDGVDVFAPDGSRVTAWQIGEPLDPSVATSPQLGYWAREFGLLNDVTHANGLWFVDADTILVSLRHLSSVIAVEGLRQDAGHIAWVVGPGSDALPADYTFADGGFAFQHHPALLADGTFTVLDNRETPVEASGGLRFALDPATGTAVEIARWPVDVWCPVQGSATLLEDDHMLIGCAGSREAIEVNPTGEIVWRMRNSCDTVADNGVVRALPMTLGDVAQ